MGKLSEVTVSVPSIGASSIQLPANSIIMTAIAILLRTASASVPLGVRFGREMPPVGRTPYSRIDVVSTFGGNEGSYASHPATVRVLALVSIWRLSLALTIASPPHPLHLAFGYRDANG